MPTFSPRSLKLLSTCDPQLRAICQEVIRYKDISVVSGRRDRAEQDELYRTGKSQLKYPDSKHNATPLSMAVDIAPWDAHNKTINWLDDNAFNVMLGHVERVAAELGIEIRTGANWDQDYEYNDSDFIDLCHVELVS
jgi:peptidoglycan L-alanyl-D-glutamate endopeptidase CwlK